MSVKKSYTAEEKAKVAIEAIKAELTLSQIATKYSVHPTQINKWKIVARNGILEALKNPSKKELPHDSLVDELYMQIGQLKVELDWLKKKSAMFSS